MLSAYALHRIYLNVLRRWGPVLVDDVAGWRSRQLHKCTFGVAFYLGLFYVLIAIVMWGLEALDNTGNGVRSTFLLVFMSGWNIGYYQWKTGVAILGIILSRFQYFTVDHLVSLVALGPCWSHLLALNSK